MRAEILLLWWPVHTNNWDYF